MLGISKVWVGGMLQGFVTTTAGRLKRESLWQFCLGLKQTQQDLTHTNTLGVKDVVA